MRVGSCFSGVGMFDYGLQQAGYEIAWQIEWDEWCRRVLTKHWPDVPKYSDIREVDANRLEPVDLLIGGYPCQPFSAAGQRQGQADDRHLWPEMFRIIQALRPTWVIGENVAGHISMGLDDVLSDLEGEGYTCQAFVIPACAVNAPHRRDRVWIVAHTTGTQRQAGAEKPGVLRALSENGAEFDHADRPDKTRADVANANTEGVEGRTNTRSISRGRANRKQYTWRLGTGATVRPTQSRLGRNADGLTDRIHAARYPIGYWPTPTAQDFKRRGPNSQQQGLPEHVRYPTALGQPQHEWEPPRVAQGIPDRVNRLKALGNGGMWQIPYIIGTFIKEVTQCTTHS